MSISANFPVANPSLLLDFAKTKVLDPRITFTRASTGTYYDASTTAKAEENLVTYSQAFYNWNRAFATVTDNNVVAPDGTTTASTIAFSQVEGAYVAQNITFVAGTYTFSVWLKAAAPCNVGIGLYSPGLITNCSVTTSWQRFTFTGSPGAGTAYPQIWPGYGAVTVYAWGAQLEQRSAVTAYTPTTSQPITNYVPVLKSAAANQPRFDHDPVTRKSLGLLIEEERTNLALYSEDLSNAYWTATGNALTITANAGVAPDGAQTADLCVADSGNTNHYVYGSYTKTSNVVQAISLYAKPFGSVTHITIQGADNGSGSHVLRGYNIVSGVVGAQSVTGDAVFVSASMTPVGNGWYRCTLVCQSSGTTGRLAIGIGGDGTLNFTGNGYSGAFIWGVQIEDNKLFSGSYIPTAAASATRSPDGVQFSGSNTSWFKLAEGTFVTKAGVNRKSTYSPTWSIAYNYGDFIPDYANSNNFRWGTTNPGIDLAVTASDTQMIAACAYTNGGTHALCINGGSVATSSANSPNENFGGTIYVGYNWSLTAFLNDRIQSFAFYPYRLTNAQLQALTGGPAS